jgi:hypothetical protein
LGERGVTVSGGIIFDNYWASNIVSCNVKNLINQVRSNVLQ